MNASERNEMNETSNDNKFMVICLFVLIPVLSTVAVLWTVGMF